MSKEKIKLVEKEKTKAFGKVIYLLGRLHGERIWLETASWDCGWYWGFGYVESYTNDKNPSISRDISCHTHYDSILGKQSNGNYAHILNDVEGLTETTLTEKEQWELSELMESFYTLKKTAEVFGRGKSNVSNTEINYKDEAISKKINDEILPKIFKRIYEILEP